jgi:hypothetical protein
MSYQNFLGEFVAPTEKDNWVNFVKWNERKPVLIRGALNPWELERTRAVWEAEKAAWAKIQPLMKEYGERERQMKRDIAVFNEHLAELERVTKKKVGLGPIGQYGGMALAVLPGFGWFSAAFSILNMGFDMLMGNKTKKRIAELMRIMEEAQQRLQRNQARLIAIQGEVKVLMDVTERAQQAGSEKMQDDLAQVRHSQEAYRLQQQTQSLLIDQELARARQLAPTRVRYVNDL